MLCQNCGENEANVRYTQIINGVKKEMALCEKCSKELGIGNLDFNMPINFSSFLGDFLEEDTNFLPDFVKPENLICNNCGMTYDEFIETGKFGCDNCYEVFSNKIDPILKNIHGGNKHVGRLGIPNKKDSNLKQDTKQEIKNDKQEQNSKKMSKLDKLQEDLKQAIKEERYEDAAKIRDEIKKIEK